MKFIRLGVTLTEVLVVALIVMVIVSLLFPVFSRARDKAKDVVCASNMRQLYSALKLYEGDFESYPPNSVVWPAFTSYYPRPLLCPRNLEGSAEFSYIVAGSASSAGSEQFRVAWRNCMDLRGPAYPLVRDLNHLKYANADLPQSVLFFVRENGSFSVVPFSNRHLVNGPCDAELLPLESNL